MQAFKSGDQNALLSLFSQEIVVYSFPELPNSGTFHGREGYLEWFQPWQDAWEVFDVDLEREVPIGERHMVLEVRQLGRGRGGIEVSMDAAFLFEVDPGGLVSYLGLFPSGEQASAAAREREDV
jgi:ketosteroid isomerase-like protein